MIWKKNKNHAWKKVFVFFPVDLHTFDQVNTRERQPDAKLTACMQFVLKREYWAWIDYMIDYIPYDPALEGKVTCPLRPGEYEDWNGET